MMLCKFFGKVLIISFLVIVIIIIGINYTGRIIFNRIENREIRKFLSYSNKKDERFFSYEQIKNLPKPVQRYFRYVLKEGQKYIDNVRIKQDGLFRLKENQDWMKVQGIQYYTIDKPGFIWLGLIRSFCFYWISVIDSYINNVGGLDVRLYSIFNIESHKGGHMMKQRNLVRWISEACQYPTALLPSKHLKWEEIDDYSARLYYLYDDINIAMVVFINEKGEITKLITDRYMNNNIKKWGADLNNYREFHGIKIPTESEVFWLLKTGKFIYYKFDVVEIDYDMPEVY